MAADSEFVFDAVIGFLTSPIWNTPVLTFVEDKCLVFDPDSEAHETYTEIHLEYKNMVETLLSSFLKDIGITTEQFTKACKARGGNAQLSDIHKNIFEQVWAAEDFEVFKRLMIQKNIELQLQALRLIQQRGQMSQENRPEEPPKPIPVAVQTEAFDEEDAIMQEVLRLSKEEYDQKSVEEKIEEQELEKTLMQSNEEQESPSSKAKALPCDKDTLHDLQASKSLTKALEEAENALELRLKLIAEREQEEMQKALKSCIISQQEPQKDSNVAKKVQPVVTSNAKSVTTAPSSTPISPPAPKAEAAKPLAAEQALPPLAPSKKSTSPADAAASWISSAKAEASSASSTTPAKVTEISKSELNRRTEYLKQQRDVLLRMKKQEREKKLHKYTKEQPKARPTSARAAHRVTAGERVISPSGSASPTDEKKLAMRRALADVLKREVIEK